MNISFLTAEELSGIMRIPKATLYALSQKGKIPAVKIGKHWRYIKDEVLNWLYKNNKYNGHEKTI